MYMDHIYIYIYTRYEHEAIQLPKTDHNTGVPLAPQKEKKFKRSVYVSMPVCFIQGVNLRRVPESDYSVTVGGLPCTELDINEAGTAITCLPPILAQVNAPIVVSVCVISLVHSDL